jgi:hypothetical protein
MDGTTDYLGLREQMEKLLAFINAVTTPPIGACLDGETCEMTTEAKCASGRWLRGVACVVPGNGGDNAQASQELLERMGRLLDRVQPTFEAGGKTYRLKMTLQGG